MKTFDRDLDLSREVQDHFTELTSYNDKSNYKMKKWKLGLESYTAYVFTKEANKTSYRNLITVAIK